MVMATISVDIPTRMRQELERLTLVEDKSLAELIRELLQAGLEQKRQTIGLTEQERALYQYYCEKTFSKEHQEMVEDFLRATAEVVPDYDYDWGEMLDE